MTETYGTSHRPLSREQRWTNRTQSLQTQTSRPYWSTVIRWNQSYQLIDKQQTEVIQAESSQDLKLEQRDSLLLLQEVPVYAVDKCVNLAYSQASLWGLYFKNSFKIGEWGEH